MQGGVFVAFGLTLLAGLATGLGSLVVFFLRKPSMSLLSFGLGFASGVMVYVSFLELLPRASDLMGESLGKNPGGWLATLCFFGGILISAIIDKLVPEPENPHGAVPLEDIKRAKVYQQAAPGQIPVADGKESSLARLGPLTALIIGLHNFPEGIATFASSLADTSLGLPVAIAVAIHNIPEGVAVAVPVFFATRSRNRAFVYSFASGLAEPLGALLAYFLLVSFLSDVVVGAMLSAVAGVMVFISFDELLPTAREYGKGHTAITGVILGMAVMAVSLLVL
jgi:ZIP family zinc transporter